MNKYLRWFLFTSAFLLLTSLVAAGIFMKYYLSPLAKDFIEEKGSAYLRSPLTVEGVAIALFPNVRATLAGVQFTVPEQNLSAKIKRVNIGVNAGLLRILQGGSLGGVSVELESPEFALVHKPENSDKKSASSEQKGPGLPTPLLAQDLALSVKVRQGSVRIKSLPATTPGTQSGTQIDASKAIDKSGDSNGDTTGAAPAAATAAAAAPRDPIEFVMQRLELSLDTTSLNSMAFEFAVSSASFFRQGKLNFALPFQFRGSTTFSDNTLSLKDTKGQISDLSFQLSGKQNLSTQTGDWTLQAQIPEISQLSLTPAFLPAGKWKGKIAASLQAKTLDKTKGWLVSGRFSALNLSGDTELIHDDLKAKGKLVGKADLTFTAAIPEKGPLAYRVERADFALDLAEMTVEKPGIFNKPIGVPLALSLFGSGSEKTIKVDQSNLRFANVLLVAQGTLHRNSGQSSEVLLQMGKTSLTGLEAYFPFLAKSPLKGSIQVSAKIQGDLEKPDSLTVQVKPLLLEKLEGAIDWASADKSKAISGVAQIDGSFNLEALGQELKSADFRFSSDLTGLAIEMKEKFIKPKDSIFRLNMTASQAGQMINFKSASLLLGTNSLNLSGQISNPQQPRLNLKASTPNLNLKELSNSVVALAKWNLSGTARGNFNISGIYDFKRGLEQSPLNLTGELSANIPRLVFPKEEKTSDQASETSNKKKPEPLLPNWPIATTAVLKTNFQLGELIYGNETLLSGFQAQSTLSKGHLQSTASIQKLFSGSASVSKFTINLAEPQPDIWLDTDLRSLDMSQALGFFSKDWQDLIKGQGSGKLSIQSPHYSRQDFLDSLRAQGSLNIKNAFVSSAQLDQMINSTLAKIPGLGTNVAPAQTNGVAADLLANFRLEKRRLALSRLVFLTPERNELQAQGSLGLDMNVDLTGTAYLSNPPIGGSIRAANSDSSGRFVIPLKIKGSLLKPEVAFAQETISQLLKSSANAEVKKATQEIQKATQKEIKTIQEDLKKKGLDALKGALGQ